MFKYIETPMYGRSLFANSILKMIYKFHDGDLESKSFQEDCFKMIDTLYENVRNFYELEREIPLLIFYKLKKYSYENNSWSDFGFENERQLVEEIKLACELFYK